MSAQINVSQKNHHMALVYIWYVFLPSLFIHVFSAAAELYDFDDDKVMKQCYVLLFAACSKFSLIIIIVFYIKMCCHIWSDFVIIECTLFFLKDENKLDFKKLVTDNWIEPTSRRERKRKYALYNYVMSIFNNENNSLLLIRLFFC